MRRYSRLVRCGLIAAVFASGLTDAQEWKPQRNVEIVVTTSPGGSNDVTARALERISTFRKLVSSSIPVVNKPGGGGDIAYAYVNQRPRDGHTLDDVSTSAVNVHGHVAAKKIRLLGVAAPQRFGGALADVPTWKEHGFDVAYGSWRAIMGPQGFSPAQVAYWENTLRKVTETAEWKDDLETNYWASYVLTGPQLRKAMDKEYADMKVVLSEIGLAK